MMTMVSAGAPIDQSTDSVHRGSPGNRETATIATDFLPLLVLLALVGLLYRGVLFDFQPTIPPCRAGVDVRAHLVRIELMRQMFDGSGSWPSWSNSLYLGFPPFQYYPPLLHLVGGLLALATSMVVAFKLLIVFNYLLSAASFAFVARRMLGVSRRWAAWSGVICSMSPPFLLSHLYGNESNILGWSFLLLSLPFYIRPRSRRDSCVAGLWIAAALSSHLYPIVFLACLSIVGLPLLLRHDERRRDTLIHAAIAWGVALLLTAWWWFPAMATAQYLSSMADPLNWLSLNSALLLLLVAVSAWASWHEKTLRDRAGAAIGLALLVSVILTVGAREIVPLLGQFLHKVRFGCLGVTTFTLLVLTGVAYQHRGRKFGTIVNRVLAVCSIVAVAIAVASLWRGELRTMLERARLVETDPDFLAIVEKLRNRRVVVPFRLGRIADVGSLVGYAPRFGFQSVTGPYSQGDPKFFRFTVHLEWEERWLFRSQTRRNVLGGAGAHYLFVSAGQRGGRLPGEPGAVLANEYGSLFSSGVDATGAEMLVPGLLDVDESQRQLVADLVNLVLPDGFELPLVDAASVAAPDRALFPVVVGTDERLVARYPGAAILLLGSTANGRIDPNARVYRLWIELTEAARYFYRGPQYDFRGWRSFDNEVARNDGIDRLLDLTAPARQEWQRFRTERVRKTPLEVVLAPESISLRPEPGSFALVRQSWFPNWRLSQGKLWNTTQGFMLTHSSSPGPLRLQYVSHWRGRK